MSRRARSGLTSERLGSECGDLCRVAWLDLCSDLILKEPGPTSPAASTTDEQSWCSRGTSAMEGEREWRLSLLHQLS